jgi:tRNA(Ile)-lysidine synthase
MCESIRTCVHVRNVWSEMLENNVAKNLQEYQSAKRWLIAYSGGLDSTVLLHAVYRLKNASPDAFPPLSAIHINHQLNPHADDWEKHCQSVCEALNIPLLIRKVAIEKNGEGLEAAARNARYQVFYESVKEGDVLLQAHHANDQAETVLLRLLRGAGVAGLSAIPGQRQMGLSKIVRPLLNITRQQLQNYATEQQLQWIEDDSNYDTRLDRNFLRQDIFPRLSERWPAAISVLSRTATQMAEDSQLLRELGDSDWHSCAADSASGEQALVVAQLLKLSAARRKNTIRSWLMQRNLSIPDSAMMQRLSDELLLAKVDAEPCLRWADVEAHRYANRLFVFKRLPEFDSSRQYEWKTASPLHIEGVGTLTMAESHNEILSVRFRAGGERCQPQGRAHSQTLKKLFQEYRVPPWLRDRLPLIYRGDDLIAVAGWWNCEGSKLPPVLCNSL